MTTMLAIHIAGGSVAVIAGYGALLARKGSLFHRYAGYAFVGGMLVMALGAMVVALQKGQTGQVVSAAFVVYLVGTAVTTFLPDSARVARLNTALRILPLLLMFFYLWRYRDRRRRVAAAPAAGIRLPDRVLSASSARADLTMKGIP